MDARITKQRLGNLLSYDWLKILVSIAAAVVALVLFFTMVGTRPTAGQTFTVYGYSDVKPGADVGYLPGNLEDTNVFSYDILKIQSESFYGNTYAGAAYEARRSSGEGTVMFVSDYAKDDGNDETKEVGTLSAMAANSLRPDPDSETGYTMYLFYSPVKFMDDAAKYLAAFFEGDWRTAETLKEAKVRETFETRNGSDKRYRFSSSKFEEGVADEARRIKKLRDDFLVVEQAFQEGKLSCTEYTDENGLTYPIAVNLSRLSSITSLYYYEDAEGSRSAELLNLIIFENYDRLGDLKYDTVSFLKYLVEKYGS